MNTKSNDGVAMSCSYCGRENAERLPACTGCGTPLVEETSPALSLPKRRSKILAVLLALALGPLGLFYASIPGGITMLLIAAPFVLTRTGNLWISIGGRIACACWAFHALREVEIETDRSGDSERLLNDAAKLESIDRVQAVAAYEDIVRRFPGTKASREATRNIDVLTRKHEHAA